MGSGLDSVMSIAVAFVEPPVDVFEGEAFRFLVGEDFLGDDFLGEVFLEDGLGPPPKNPRMSMKSICGMFFERYTSDFKV